MRRSVFALFILTIFLCSSLAACAKTNYKRVEPRISFSEAAVQDRGYGKKAAIVLIPHLATPFGQAAEALYYQSLIDAIRKTASRVDLVTQLEGRLPAYIAQLAAMTDEAQVYPVLEKARFEGFQFLSVAALQNVAGEDKKSGIWWFRKTRYFVTVELALNVYDTTTGAKIIEQVPMETVRIEINDYEEFTRNGRYDIAPVSEAIGDMAEELGETAGESMADQPWMTSIIDARDDMVRLSAGPSSGLKPNDRLTLFEGRQRIEGPDGQIYVIPGYRLTGVVISGFTDDRAEARIEDPVAVQPGDIAMPTR